jgi:hypothetical protein
MMGSCYGIDNGDVCRDDVGLRHVSCEGTNECVVTQGGAKLSSS